MIDLSSQCFFVLFLHGPSPSNCPDISQNSSRTASTWAPVLTWTLPFPVFPLETFLIPWSHHRDRVFTRVCPLYFRWTGMHRQLKKKLRGRESSGEEWLFFHKTIKISVLKQPSCPASLACYLRQHPVLCFKESCTKSALTGQLPALLILPVFSQVGTSLPKPYFNQLRSPWPSPWQVALAGGFLNGFLAPGRSSFLSQVRWQQRSLSSLFLALACLVNSNGSWQGLAGLQSWQGAAGCLLAAWLVRGARPSPWGRETRAWNEAEVHPTSFHAHGGGMRAVSARIVNYYFYASIRNNSQSWSMAPGWWLCCCFTFPVSFPQRKERLQALWLTLSSRLSDGTASSFTTTCEVQYFPGKCYFPLHDTV